MFSIYLESIAFKILYCCFLYLSKSKPTAADTWSSRRTWVLNKTGHAASIEVPPMGLSRTSFVTW